MHPRRPMSVSVSRSDARDRRGRNLRGERSYRAQRTSSPRCHHVEIDEDVGRLVRGAGGESARTSVRHRCDRVRRHWLRRVCIAPRCGLKLALSDNSPFFGNRKQTHGMWAFCFRRGVAHRPVLRQDMTLSLLPEGSRSPTGAATGHNPVVAQ